MGQDAKGKEEQMTTWVPVTGEGEVTSSTSPREVLVKLYEALGWALDDQNGALKPLDEGLRMGRLLGEAALLIDLSEGQETEGPWFDAIAALIEALCEALDEFSPEGCTFGRAPGGGGLGWWPLPGAATDEVPEAPYVPNEGEM